MKSGFVCLLGRPNSGKSTLLNSIIKKKVSIVTDKSQTTRNTILGIHNSATSQIIFIDTPGIHKPRVKLGEEMNKMAHNAVKDVDVVVLVVDASIPFLAGDKFVIENIEVKNTPMVIVFNKIDKAFLDKTLKLKTIYQEKFPNAILLDTIATEGFNIDLLIKQIEDLLPEGPCYYPNDVITDKDEIFQIKEIIREKALKTLKDEVPHSLAVYMEDIVWEKTPVKIKASLVVEKDGQKGIVIGANGKRIRDIGDKARKDIEKLLDKKVNLELFVKVEKDWRNTNQLLKTFGYKLEK